ncbi:hypothetical protein PH5382_01163 [Phaeobacter sp. CECT 5382]|nr:hypothetical protein PH5382_01163 [Phaeobacter sp. CECT 5382]
MIRASHIETARALGAAPAAPAGGAQLVWGRGCGYMAQLARDLVMPLVALSMMASLPAVARAQSAGKPIAVEVPSGQAVALNEVLLDESPGELWARFRFVAPAIERSADVSDAVAKSSEAMTYERSAADMDHLCESLVLDYLRRFDLAPARVVISLSDRPVAFGTKDAEATQFFEAYRPASDGCIWEAF